jgi:GNAT superfamily N-acetyltransferase
VHPPPLPIRLAQEQDLPHLQDIERAAGQPFAALGMHAVADDAPPSLGTLREFLHAGRAWVAVTPDDRPVAYLVAVLIDGTPHVEQVSVHPDHAGQRLGRALLEHLAAWAREQGHTALTLTTFTEVPWNGPYYARCGFRFLTDAELTPGLRQVRAAEAARGLDRWPRCAMRREL